MKKAIVTLGLAAGLALAGCQTLPDNPTASKTVYSGVTPCADCSGIRTTLTLYRNQDHQPSRYELRQQYLDGSKPKASHVNRGNWAASTTQLDGRQYPLYTLNPNDPEGQQSFVQNAKNAVEMLDANGQLIQSGLNYTLIQR